MDFGSDYIFLDDGTQDPKEIQEVAQEDEEEYVEEYTGGFECEIIEFDDEDEMEQRLEEKVQRKEKKVNTNNVQIAMTKLTEQPDVIVEMSKLIKCQSQACSAVFSHLAKQDLDRKVWICGFCGSENEIKNELPDLTGKSDVLYVDDVNKTPHLKPSENSKIIFVIDTSASMCQSKTMDPNKISQKLKEIVQSDIQKQIDRMKQHGVGEIQAPAIESSKIEVSRLQAIKACVIEVIDKLRESNQQNLLVGLVVFHEHVVVYGDGSKHVEVQGGQLADMNELKRVGTSNTDLCPLSQSTLNERIYSLEDFGLTALGPALVVALGMTELSHGSKVILCTDGVANIGKGSLEKTTPEEIKAFYDEVIDYSNTLGTSVSIMCVDNAGIDTKLGQVPTETGGSLEKIEAEFLEAKITEELKRPTVAVGAIVQFIVHRDLYVNNTVQPECKDSRFYHEVGNLQLDKQVSFSFNFKPDSSQQQIQGQQQSSSSQASAGNDNQENLAQPINDTSDGQPLAQVEKPPSDSQSLPFQVQITYTDFSGVKAVRIWTTERKMTRSRAQVEEATNWKTTTENYLQTSSKELWDKIVSNQDYITLTKEMSSSAHQFSIKLTGHPDLKQKVTNFMTLLNSIKRSQKITEDQITILKDLFEAKPTQAQG